MNKKFIAFVIISSFVFGGIGGWVLVRYVFPGLNSNKFFARWNLLPQTAPLVMTRVEEVHVNEGTDSVTAIQHVQPWVVGIVSGPDQAHATLSAAGVILTSDGLIATTKSAIPASTGAKQTAAPVINVVFPDGATSQATVKAEDSASDIVFLKANVNGEPTASFGYPSEMQLGQRIIVLSPTLDEHEAAVQVSYLSSTVRSLNPLAVYSSETIAETFGVDGATGLDGAAVVALDGSVEGLFDHDGLVTADTVRSAMNSYFSQGKIVRTQLGVKYQYTPISLASLYGTQQGAAVTAVATGSAAAQAGFQVGDVVTQVGGTAVSLDSTFESLLGRYSDGQTVPFTVKRGKDTVTLTVKISQK